MGHFADLSVVLFFDSSLLLLIPICVRIELFATAVEHVGSEVLS